MPLFFLFVKLPLDRRGKDLRELKYLNDKVIKKALAKEKPVIRNYIAKLISDVTKIPYEDLENKLELVYPEVSKNVHLVNSEVDLIFKEDTVYFNIEINYGRSSTLKVKNLSYVFQLSLRQMKSYHDYKNMKPVIQININSYDPYGYDAFLYESEMMVKDYGIVHNEMIKIYDINLAYYKNIDYNEIEKEKLLKDLAFLVIEEKEVLDKLYKGDKIMDSVQRELKGLVEEVDGILYYDEAKLQEGIEREMTEKGKKEKSLEIARNLLILGVNTIEQIAEVTKLSVSEIKKLQEN